VAALNPMSRRRRSYASIFRRLALNPLNTRLSSFIFEGFFVLWKSVLMPHNVHVNGSLIVMIDQG
jgi:hypothetical protein